MPKRAAEVGVGKLTRVNEATVACPASFSGRRFIGFYHPHYASGSPVDQPSSSPAQRAPVEFAIRKIANFWRQSSAFGIANSGLIAYL